MSDASNPTPVLANVKITIAISDKKELRAALRNAMANNEVTNAIPASLVTKIPDRDLFQLVIERLVKETLLVEFPSGLVALTDTQVRLRKSA